MKYGRFAVTFLCLVFLCCRATWAQSGGTGALTGTITDRSGASIPNATVRISNPATGFDRTTTTDSDGVYRLTLLPPGSYTVTFEFKGFAKLTHENVTIDVTETETLNTTLQVNAAQQTVEVSEGAELIQTETTTLGRVVDEAAVKNLPLTNRNYTQILALSPGVASDLTDAGQLGRNTPDVFVNGARATDNSFQMDGAPVNNFGSGRAGDWLGYTGIPIPNPDAIQEFKIQTGLYDAAYGRGAGANVNVVTKSGSNQFHGSAFEFFRNTVLNANDFFLKKNGQPRPKLNQNQFGAVIGGPILKDKWFFFGSYQGTRQINGEGSSSLASVFLPPLTNDRSAATLGAEFCGQSGAKGGTSVACDGSNINSVALNLLQFKLPSGGYYIPTPQVIQASGQGFSVFSVPSRWTEDQALFNSDFVISTNNTIHARYFYSRDPQAASFTGSNVPGSGAQSSFNNQLLTLSDTAVLGNSLVNEARISVLQNKGNLHTLTPLQDSTLGITPASDYTVMPIITVDGSFTLGGTWNDDFKTDVYSFVIGDQLSLIKGKHSFRFGGEFEHIWDNFDLKGPKRGSLEFLSFPDFLLGLSGAQNGTPYSNIFDSSGMGGFSDKQFRVKNSALFAQDDYKVSPRLTLNMGLRWDIFGSVTEARGRIVNFWPDLAQNTFPPGGTLAGFVAADNFPGTLPAGVVRTGNNSFSQNGTPLADLGPRIGLAWRPLKNNDRLVIRAGYGIYYTRTSGNDVLQLNLQPPFIINFRNDAINNSLATFQMPFNPAPPPPAAYPVWLPRTATTQLTVENLERNFKSPTIQQFSLNLEEEFARNYLFQIGYVGSRGTHLLRFREANQAQLASLADPINGVTDNTIENVNQRVPVLGMPPNGLLQLETAGSSWYNALQTSVTKRFSKGLQFEVAYTFSKTLDDVPASTGQNTVWGGFFSNNVYDNRQAWGPAEFNRPHRLVISYLWNLPRYGGGEGFAGKALSGWAVSGVTTFQSGRSLTVLDARAGTIYGASFFLWQTRGQLCPGITASQVATSGSVNSRLNDYFNPNAFCAPPAISDGTDFGNAGRGLVRGPDQRNFDIAITKDTALRFRETANLQFRAEFFNVFNTPQFGDPGLFLPFGNFGQISNTIVAPRLIQFALKLSF